MKKSTGKTSNVSNVLARLNKRSKGTEKDSLHDRRAALLELLRDSLRAERYSMYLRLALSVIDLQDKALSVMNRELEDTSKEAEVIRDMYVEETAKVVELSEENDMLKDRTNQY
jgi:hypothetical protein